MNSALKHAAERILIVAGAARLAARRFNDGVLVLAYHNIVPDDTGVTGDGSLHLARSEFARQLDILAESHSVVPIDALFRDPLSKTGPLVAITFDDAYAGAINIGITELVKRQMPATVFVAPGLLGSVPWWDAVAESGAVPEKIREYALGALRGDASAILGWARDSSTSNSAPPLPRIAGESELSEIAATPGITFASHSWSHCNLATLSCSELEAELTRPVEWLRSRFPAVVPYLSYPYGIRSDTVERVAEQAGYIGAFRIDGGWMMPPIRQRYALRRLNIPAGLSADGFRLRLAGL